MKKAVIFILALFILSSCGGNGADSPRLDASVPGGFAPKPARIYEKDGDVYYIGIYNDEISVVISYNTETKNKYPVVQDEVDRFIPAGDKIYYNTRSQFGYNNPSEIVGGVLKCAFLDTDKTEEYNDINCFDNYRVINGKIYFTEQKSKNEHVISVYSENKKTELISVGNENINILDASDGFLWYGIGNIIYKLSLSDNKTELLTENAVMTNGRYYSDHCFFEKSDGGFIHVINNPTGDTNKNEYKIELQESEVPFMIQGDLIYIKVKNNIKIYNYTTKQTVQEYKDINSFMAAHGMLYLIIKGDLFYIGENGMQVRLSSGGKLAGFYEITSDAVYVFRHDDANTRTLVRIDTGTLEITEMGGIPIFIS